MIRLLDSVNDPGRSRDSEDPVGCDPHRGLAWVIDGATNVCATRLFPATPSDAFWFAGQADRLRGFEADAADDIRFGRFKTSDDAAALLIELT